ALAAKATDVYVGRNDAPRELPAPTTVSLSGGNATASVAQATQLPLGTTISPTPNPQPEAQPTQRRRRPTQAEIAADNAAQQGPQQQPASGSAPSAQPQMAPFRPEAPAQQSNGGVAFGIGAGQQPSAELAQTLDSIFGPQ